MDGVADNSGPSPSGLDHQFDVSEDAMMPLQAIISGGLCVVVELGTQLQVVNYVGTQLQVETHIRLNSDSSALPWGEMLNSCVCMFLKSVTEGLV